VARKRKERSEVYVVKEIKEGQVVNKRKKRVTKRKKRVKKRKKRVVKNGKERKVKRMGGRTKKLNMKRR
jgi:hypothetical protein